MPRPGQVLHARTRAHQGRTCEIGADGRLFVDGTPFDTPSGAAKGVTGSQSEAGWWFWVTELGSDRCLSDIRAEYLGGLDDADEDA